MSLFAKNCAEQRRLHQFDFQVFNSYTEVCKPSLGDAVWKHVYRYLKGRDIYPRTTTDASGKKQPSEHKIRMQRLYEFFGGPVRMTANGTRALNATETQIQEYFASVRERLQKVPAHRYDDVMEQFDHYCKAIDFAENTTPEPDAALFRGSFEDGYTSTYNLTPCQKDDFKKVVIELNTLLDVCYVNSDYDNAAVTLCFANEPFPVDESKNVVINLKATKGCYLQVFEPFKRFLVGVHFKGVELTAEEKALQEEKRRQEREEKARREEERRRAEEEQARIDMEAARQKEEREALEEQIRLEEEFIRVKEERVRVLEREREALEMFQKAMERKEADDERLRAAKEERERREEEMREENEWRKQVEDEDRERRTAHELETRERDRIHKEKIAELRRKRRFLKEQCKYDDLLDEQSASTLSSGRIVYSQSGSYTPHKDGSLTVRYVQEARFHTSTASRVNFGNVVFEIENGADDGVSVKINLNAQEPRDEKYTGRMTMRFDNHIQDLNSTYDTTLHPDLFYDHSKDYAAYLSRQLELGLPIEKLDEPVLGDVFEQVLEQCASRKPNATPTDASPSDEEALSEPESDQVSFDYGIGAYNIAPEPKHRLKRDGFKTPPRTPIRQAAPTQSSASMFVSPVKVLPSSKQRMDSFLSTSVKKRKEQATPTMNTRKDLSSTDSAPRLPPPAKRAKTSNQKKEEVHPFLRTTTSTVCTESSPNISDSDNMQVDDIDDYMEGVVKNGSILVFEGREHNLQREFDDTGYPNEITKIDHYKLYLATQFNIYQKLCNPPSDTVLRSIFDSMKRECIKGEWKRVKKSARFFNAENDKADVSFTSNVYTARSTDVNKDDKTSPPKRTKQSTALKSLKTSIFDIEVDLSRLFPLRKFEDFSEDEIAYAYGIYCECQKMEGYPVKRFIGRDGKPDADMDEIWKNYKS